MTCASATTAAHGPSRFGLFLAAGLLALAPGLPGAAAAAVPTGPALAIVAPFPGASVEEVEQQVTILLEVALAGLPGLEHTRTQSRFGLSRVRLHFKKNTDPNKARQEVINRLQRPQLPAGVIPQVALVPAGVLVRYTLNNPRDPQGRSIYTASDLQALQDGVLRRAFLRIPRVADVVRFGGAVKRYEIRPDLNRLRRHGVTLEQLARAVIKGNANVGGDLLPGRVRGVGLFGDGRDPLNEALAKKDARAAAAHLRAEEIRRLRAIRSLVVARVNRVPILVADLVEGGRLKGGDAAAARGVVTYQSVRGKVGFSRPRTDDKGRVVWTDEEDRVEGAVLLRQGEDAKTALRDVKARIKELNDTAGRLLPGVRIEVHDEGTKVGLAPAAGATWLQANLPTNIGLEEAARTAATIREVLRRQPEVAAVLSRVGGSQDGFDPDRFGRAQCFVALKPGKEWPALKGNKPRTLSELQGALRQELNGKVPGVDWSFSPVRRDTFAEAFTAAPGAGLLKIYGPDLKRLQDLARQAKEVLERFPGVAGVRVVPLAGAEPLHFRLDAAKCARWGVSRSEAVQTLTMALHGKTISQMVEGDKAFAIVLRWPVRSGGVEDFLDVPVNVGTGPVGKPPAITSPPQVRLRDLLTPLDKDGKADPKGHQLRAGVAVIYREDGKRLIAVRYGVRGQVETTTPAARKKMEHLFKVPYRAVWEDR